ncbi:MAG: hypothetical protein OHK0039_04420 [Bacteroidia bacterium]
MTLTFNELRKMKDRLPDGSMHQIASELGLSVETVRNYFGGEHYDRGEVVGIHIEPGPDGGLVYLDDTSMQIIARAREMLGKSNSTGGDTE